jgi:hypothetical protein
MQHKENMMSTNYFQQKNVNPIFNSFEKPIKELLELQVRTAQDYSYMTPVELLSVRKPEEIIEKNMTMFINNSHKTLDYIHNMFNIMEKHWLNTAQHITINTKNTLTDAMDITKRSARSVDTHLKDNTKQAKASIRKSVEKSGVKEATKKTTKVTKKETSGMAKKPDSVSTSKTSDKGKQKSSSQEHIKPAVIKV